MAAVDAAPVLLIVFVAAARRVGPGAGSRSREVDVGVMETDGPMVTVTAIGGRSRTSRKHGDFDDPGAQARQAKRPDGT
ncbi:MAG: hypothetical protein LBP92_05345 [Deltaproteobacteria bacterium]|jgi:hypothetical protein|nr:hypothetical protein [Deltaproteobacteria bacterium]